ncbi:MAG: DHH family phosphoesterase [Richelia sp. SM1_7_0]|nr:DHH family phosphoesterase [Richelia sp. SM1_7_0]
MLYNIQRFINYTEEELIERFLTVGEKSVAERDLRIKKYVDKGYRQTILGEDVIVTEVTEYDADIVSKIGHNLCNENTFASYAVVATTTDNGCYVSFRSNGFDCEPVAKSFGGGGHPQACGCKVENLTDIFDDD